MDSIPAGWTEHDVDARNVVRRYVGNLAPALKDIYGDAAFAKLADILGAADDYPELTQKPAFAQVPQLVLNDALHAAQARGRRRRQGVQADHRRDRASRSTSSSRPSPPSATTSSGRARRSGSTRATRSGPIFTNNLKETTGVHFHGVEFDDFFQDGVPFVTQKPIVPGETYTYEFTASNSGSLMYHSHHNATDQVGRGLLGAFIVEPKADPVTVRPRVHLDLERLARRVHDQRPRLPGRRAGPRRGRRDRPDPVHERGDHDAPVAPPRVRR